MRFAMQKGGCTGEAIAIPGGLQSLGAARRLAHFLTNRWVVFLGSRIGTQGLCLPH